MFATTKTMQTPNQSGTSQTRELGRMRRNSARCTRLVVGVWTPQTTVALKHLVQPVCVYIKLSVADNYQQQINTDTPMQAKPVFHRPQYAADLAQQLLKPTALQVQVRSGVFLSGIRRIGKTTFLRQDLVPALESMGTLVIYVDLWADRSKSPASLVHEAVKATLSALAAPGTQLLSRFKGLNVGAAGFSFGFQVDAVGKPGGATLAAVFTELVDQVKTDVVLIIDEVQQALGTEEGGHLLFALKAARDAVNTRPGTPGYLLFLGTGSHKSLVADMATRRSQPFAGAVSTGYEPLGSDFVSWKEAQLKQIKGIKLPSHDVMYQGFLALGQRPEELQNALVLLQSRPEDANVAFPIICSSLASAAAEVEIATIETLGTLASAIFDRVVHGNEQGESGLFSADAINSYAEQIGTTVDTPQVQNMVDRMITANVMHRQSHGVYAVADPFVRQAWRQRKAMQLPPSQ
ncbi:ATP-binding protein [Hydrogenophaga sp.]|uniref:ATP-binding protein n=1 Tax=Hydrogenophaga sp. TaxID=1904254 RepID=UPI00272DBA4F|nr:ATP-binding protein [Hydrogenophaga sp.]